MQERDYPESYGSGYFKEGRGGNRARGHRENSWEASNIQVLILSGVYKDAVS